MRALSAVLGLILFVSCFSENFALNPETSLVVVGSGECGDCKKFKIPNVHAFTGLRVNIDCKVSNGEFKTRGRGELDKNGNFNVQLPNGLINTNGELVEECFANLFGASNNPCPSSNGLSKLSFKTKDNQKHIFTAPKLSFSASLCPSAFLFKGGYGTLPKLPFPSLPPFGYHHPFFPPYLKPIPSPPPTYYPSPSPSPPSPRPPSPSPPSPSPPSPSPPSPSPPSPRPPTPSPPTSSPPSPRPPTPSPPSPPPPYSYPTPATPTYTYPTPPAPYYPPPSPYYPPPTPYYPPPTPYYPPPTPYYPPPTPYYPPPIPYYPPPIPYYPPPTYKPPTYNPPPYKV